MRRSRFDATGAPDQHGVPKRDLCKQERLEVGAAKWERRSFEAKFLCPKVVRTVAFSVAFILTLRHIRA